MAVKPLNSVGGFSVGKTPVTIIYPNGAILVNNFSTTGKSNLNSIGNVYISGGSNGQVIQTDGLGNLSFITINTSSISNGNSNVQVLANANITFSSAGNANIVVITGTGVNVTGYLNVNGNAQFNNANLGNLATANFANFANDVVVQGNIANANNVSITNNLEGNTANFSGNLTSLNANLGNLVIANFANFANDVVVQGNIANANNVSITNNLEGNTANFSGNITSLNANLGNLVTANFANFANDVVVQGNIANANNVSITNNLEGNTANFSGNITSLNANLGNLVTANFANFANDVVVQGNIANANNISITNNLEGNTANFSGNLTSLNANLGNLITANYANLTNDLVVQGNIANANNFSITHNLEGNTANFSGNITSLNANLGNLVTANFANFANDVVVQGNIANANNISITNNLEGNTANFSGNITSLNANLGNLVIANFANFANDVVVQGNIANANNVSITHNLEGNTANFSGNITSLNANLGNLVTANFANFANDVVVQGNIANANNVSITHNLEGNTANFSGNVVAANFVGPLSNGISNVKVYNNANIEFTINGTANVATISSTGLFVAGEINTTTGNMLSNGNITANLFLNSANANVTGEALLGSVKTANIIAPVGTITISAAGADNNIILSPTGVGNVDVGLHHITQVSMPINPGDAATKEYVDNVGQGLVIHPPANVTAISNLTASYLNGGTVLSVTDITGNKTITFSVNHGLLVNSDIEFTNSFNGIIAGEGYYVFSTPTLDSITIKDGYFGAEVTTLVDGTGLTQPALGNAGVGATLTNAGVQIALTIDVILMTVGARVLVQGQTNQFENGIYDVTIVGTGATNWVLTRSSDGDSYAPQSINHLASRSYFFISQGSQFAGSSYVLTSPTGEIHFGVTNIVFTQFSKASSYTSGPGIYVNGTVISANVDNETTAIAGGNIVVKASANLTTPNLGDATFSSLSWNNLSNGNVTANNLSIGNIANITGNLRVDGVIQSNGNISSNTNINSNNAYFTNFANIGGNLLANNITSNNAFSTNTANITSNLITSNATINLELSGNTANFSGNITSLNANLGNLITANFANFANDVVVQGNIANANNISITNNLEGNTANFSGNIASLNANLGNLVTANFANFANDVVVQGNIANANNISVTYEITSNTANVIGNLTTGNANLGNLATANNFSTGGNVTLSDGNVIGANVVIANSFTSNGGLVDFATNNANVQLGNIGNVYIYGGTAGQVIQTDGFGNLIFGAGGGGGGASLSNGNSNIQILANANIVFSSAGNANIFVISGTGVNVAGYLTVTGNVELGSVSNVNITGGSNGQVLQTDGLGNLSFVDGGGGASLSNGSSNIRILENANIVFSSAGNANIVVITDTGANVTGTINVTGDAEFYNANLGNLATANYANFTYDVVVQGNIANANNINVTYEITSNTANVIGNLTTGNANLGNLVTANFANFTNDVVVQGNIANANNVSVTYNVKADSANVTRELDVGGNIVTGTGSGGNITGVNYLTANFINTGSIANGTSNIRITQNGNVTISSNNTSNVFTISNLGANVIGYVQANGIISAGGFVGSNLVANVGTLSLTAKQGGTAYNINLLAGGAGNIDVGTTFITGVKSPINSQDAATKEYVDNISQGLLIHPPADVLTTSNLTASYLNGGTPLTVESITGGKTITFNSNHGLIAFDAVSFTNSFLGIIGGAAYFVYSAPTLNSITVKTSYDGTEVTTLTNFPTLSEPALGNGGVGATLTNSGANIALTIDSVLMTVGARVLVIGQTNQFENGIYDVTTVGVADAPGPGVPWVLTRSSDGDSYQPKSATALCVGSYFFISQGTDYSGSSFTLTEPTGEIQIGISNIVFTQFSAAGAYTPGQGINISGTIISANVDNTTTAIVGGNIVVKTSANLITPNIGDAIGTSLTLTGITGNLIAVNADLGNLATANFVTVANSLQTNNLNITGNIVSSLLPYVAPIAYASGFSLGSVANKWNKVHLGNAGVYIGDYIISVIETVEFLSPVYRLTVSGGPLHAANFVATNSVTANVSISANGGNIYANSLLGPPPTSAYISGGYVFANNITVTNAITAASISATTLFTGLPNTQIVYANATQSLVSNAYFTYNTPNEVLSIGSDGTQLGGNTGNGFINVTTANVGNIKVAVLSDTQVVYANSTKTLVGNATFTYDDTNEVLTIGSGVTKIGGNVGNGFIDVKTANVGTTVKIGVLTQITYGNVTTTSVTANQTIASLLVAGITGAEFLVKAIDSGGKYSVATVSAVTNGTTVDYSVYGTVQLGGYTGNLAVNVVGGDIRLQVTPASSNSTIWVTQARII